MTATYLLNAFIHYKKNNDTQNIMTIVLIGGLRYDKS